VSNILHPKFFAFHLFVKRVEQPEEKKVSFAPRLCLSALENASRDIQDKIWGHILMFALYLDLGQARPSSYIQAWRKEVLGVSKAFHVSRDSRLQVLHEAMLKCQ
jgi:hypothetical protein